MDNQLDLTSKVQWQGSDDKKFFFDVAKEPLKFRGKSTGKQIIYNATDETFIGINSNSYGLILNENLHNSVVKFRSLDFKRDANRSYSNGRDYFKMIYTPEKLKAEALDRFNLGGKDDGGNLFPRLSITNSYNGWSPVTVALYLERFVCANMLSLPVKGTEYVFSIKHWINNVDDVQTELEKFIIRVFSEDTFSRLGDFVQEAKTKKDMFLTTGFLANFPMKVSIPFLALLRERVDLKVEIRSYQANTIFNLQTEMYKIIEDICVLRAMKGKAIGNWIGHLDEFHNIDYPEAVTNEWAVYNLLVKIVQVRTIGKRRYELTRNAANIFVR